MEFWVHFKPSNALRWRSYGVDVTKIITDLLRAEYTTNALEIIMGKTMEFR